MQEKSPLGSSKQRSMSPVARGHEEIAEGDAAADDAGASPGKSRDWYVTVTDNETASRDDTVL
jgi:hypothetical protein